MSRHISNAALREAYAARRRGDFNPTEFAVAQILWINQRRRHDRAAAFMDVRDFRNFVRRCDIASFRMLLGEIEEQCGYEIALAGLDI